MKLLIHDMIGAEWSFAADKVIVADGRYAPCKGCFHCWTKHSARCDYTDSLEEIARVLGEADTLIIATRNCYGSYSPQVKILLDRAIGTSTPLSTYRGGKMHHGLRYGKKDAFLVSVYGPVTEKEKATWRLLVANNAVNEGYLRHRVDFFPSSDDVKEALT